jgi:hypothetical protein
MTIHLGFVPAGSTLYIPFHTFNSSGASVTISGLAVTDIEIYKNGSVTQRASDSGYALLDTDGIDFDGLTGIHGFSIDTSDNTTAGFYSSGAFFWVVVSAITVDSQTVSFVAATFYLGPAPADVLAISGDTTAADNLETAFDDTAGAVPWQLISDQGTLQSVTNTTTVVLRAAASAEDDVYIGHTIHFVSATTGAKQSALISDYVGATKTVTLATAVPVALTGTVVYKIAATAPSPTNADITAILADTNELQTDWANGGRLDVILDARASQTTANAIETDTQDIQSRIPATLNNGCIQSDVQRINDVTVLGAGTSGDKWRA